MLNIIKLFVVVIFTCLYSNELCNAQHNFQQEEGTTLQQPGVYQLQGISENRGRVSAIDSVIAAADSQYVTSELREFLLGKHYRKTWATPIKVPVLDLTKKDGEYTLTGRASGIQTETLFARDRQGKRFAIRTLNKDLKQFIPKMLQRDFIVNVVQEQVSASYPYAKLITAPLAHGGGVYSTAAKVVYVVADSTADITMDISGGNLAIQEEFVSGELVRKKYGHKAIDETYSTEEVAERLLNEPNLKVDQQYTLKVRLFDMLINDWHRHEEQYIWIEIEQSGGPNLLRPFPIDRDNAFLVTDGVIPWLGTRKWGARKFQHFGPDITDMKGMNYVPRYFDRRFLNDLSREQWLNIAADLKSEVTDSLIEASVKQLPKKLYEKRGEFFIDILKKRRNKIIGFADRYYKILNRKVDIVGTNYPDQIKIEYNSAGDIRFVIKTDHPRQDIKSDTLIVKPKDTKSVRLYGMDGKDTFTFNIATRLPVDLHIVGGDNRDVFVRDDIARSMGNVHVHGINIPRKSDIELEARTSDFTKRMMNLYGYNYQEFEYNTLSPIFDFSINEDDGLFLGGGTSIIRHGFRKYPFKVNHRLSANAAFNTGSFNVEYEGEFIRAVGKADLIIRSDIAAPNSRTNFFGFGNETPEIRDSDFHTVRIDQIFNMGLLRYKLLRFMDFEVGSTYEIFNPKRNENRFVNTPAAGLDKDSFELKHFMGLIGNLKFNFTDDRLVHKQGLEALFSTKLTHSFDDNEPFLTMKYLLKYFKPVESLQTTFATRVGMARNIGNFEFYQANTLGGQISADPNSALLDDGNFRGMPRHRLSGRTVFYQNSDARITISTLDSFLIPGELGILALVDHGRVWNSELSSSKWHVGAGGGIWFNALNKFILNLTWATSDLDQTISINLGFLF